MTPIGVVGVALRRPCRGGRAWPVGRRILLVDDDPMVCTAMRALQGGRAAECVRCDFRLPGDMDGIALLERRGEERTP